MARGVQPDGAVQLTKPPTDGQSDQRVKRQLGEFRLVAECHAADSKRGGDFYYASPGMQGRLAVVIGDACGRGADGAKLVHALMPSVSSLTVPGFGPARLLAHLNRRAVEVVPEDRFVTAAAFDLDARNGRLVVANAGHVPALLRHAGGGVSLIGRPSGPALGILPNATYREERVPIRHGDLIVFMTDGILEAVENDLVDMRHLRELVDLAPDGRVHSSVGRVLRDVERTGDDRTLVSLEISGGPRTRRTS